MTNKKKISHTIEVLEELTRRVEAGNMGGIVWDNVRDLIKLLERPHKGMSSKSTFSSEARDAADRLFNHIKGRKPNFREPNFNKWSWEMDKILRIDKRTVTQLHEIIDWVVQDSFWANNILSPSKLRKQLDRLELQMGKDFHWQRGKLQRTVKDGPTPKEIYMKGLKQ